MMATRWITKYKTEQVQEALATQAESARHSLAAKTIKTDGPKFWDALLPTFEGQCLEMEEIGFKAHAYELPNPYCEEEKTYRIDVQAMTNWPETAFALLVYTVGSSAIKVTGDIPKLTDFRFLHTEDGLRITQNRDSRILDTEDLAGYVLEGLVEAIKEARKG
jgi:hypothetical protein